MKVYRDLDGEYNPSKGCVLAVGNFDGVHIGHQRIFEAAVKNAKERGIEAVLLTFSCHPAALLKPDEIPKPLMKVPDRLKIAETFGFDAAFILDFDPELAVLSPERFVEDVLVGRLGVNLVVAGESWRFGHGRQGDMPLMKLLGRRTGFEVNVVDPFMDDNLPVSSTRIRGALSAGDVAAAGALLGRPHFIRGTVVRGKGRGRELGFPTVNLLCDEVLVPGDGVYAGGYSITGSRVETEPGIKAGKRSAEADYGAAAISIGTSPTFGNGLYTVEAHLVGWEKDLYGETVTIVFLERLRDQYYYSSTAELAEQIARDVNSCRDLFSVHDLKEIPL